MRNTRNVEDLLPSRILEATNPGRERCYRQPRENPESTKGYCPKIIHVYDHRRGART